MTSFSNLIRNDTNTFYNLKFRQSVKYNYYFYRIFLIEYNTFDFYKNKVLLFNKRNVLVLQVFFTKRFFKCYSFRLAQLLKCS